MDRIVEECLKDKISLSKGAKLDPVNTQKKVRSVAEIPVGAVGRAFPLRARWLPNARNKISPVPMPQLYFSVWDAYNAWVLDQMLKRKGADCPSLANISWEFYSKATDPADPESFQMRCKPAFVLSDQFRRNNSIPKSKKLLLPTLSPSDMINFHKLALRYSTSLTKDMIFTTFRDIVRKIGEIVGSGRRIKLEFSVGVLHSKDRKVKFEFDPVALKMQGGENPIVFAMEKPLDASAAAAQRAKEEREGDKTSTRVPKAQPASPPAELDERESEAPRAQAPSPAVSREKEEFSSQENEAHAQLPDAYANEGDEDAGDRRFADTNADAIPQEAVGTSYMGDNGDMEVEAEQLLPTKGNSIMLAVQEEAYERYIKLLEDDAVEENNLNALLVTLQEQKDMKETQKKAAASKKLKDLQAYQLEQMKKQHQMKVDEKIDRKAASATSFYPRAGQEEAIEVENRRKIQNPFGVPVSRKFLGIPGVPKKGLGYRLSEDKLLEDLTAQIELKKRRAVEAKSMKREEEIRYIEHIAMEMDYDSESKKLEAQSKKTEMLQAWEREKFLRKMKALRLKGDIEGLRRHHESHKMRSSQSQSQSLPAISNQHDSSRSKSSAGGFSDVVSVGFDSRR